MLNFFHPRILDLVYLPISVISVCRAWLLALLLALFTFELVLYASQLLFYFLTMQIRLSRCGCGEESNACRLVGVAVARKATPAVW